MPFFEHLSRCVALLAWLTLAAPALAEPTTAEPAPDPPADALLADLAFVAEAPPQRAVIDLAPEGHTRRMPLLLDTSANATLVTPRAAKALGINVRPHKSSPYRRATVLGRDLLFRVDTRRSDTAATGGGWEYALLGGDFLADFVVELDFQGRRVRFYDPERYAVPAESRADGEAVLPITLVSNRPAVEARINGEPLTLLVDTAMPPALLLSGEFARKVGVESRPQPGFEISSVSGPVETEIGQARQVALGPLLLEDVVTAVAPNGFMNYGLPGDSVIGYDLLEEFTLRIDYPRRRLFLRRNAPASDVASGAMTP